MKKLVAYPAAALALLASGTALAQQTEITSIGVSAEVVAACSTVTATDVDFGTAAAADVPDDATSTITVTCDTGAPYTLELDYGATPLAGTTIRQVSGANGERMDYFIYQDAAMTTPWGTVAEGEEFRGTGTGAADPLTAYFRLHRTSGTSPGTYTDIVGVTLTF